MVKSKAPKLTDEEIAARAKLRSMVLEYFEARKRNSIAAEPIAQLMVSSFPLPKLWPSHLSKAFDIASQQVDIATMSPGFFKLDYQARGVITRQPYKSAARDLIDMHWGMTDR